jgi:O-antigen/teichoic acid export membrane protein
MKYNINLKSLFKDSFIYGTADLIQKGISFLLLPLYTRYLNPDDYGLLAILIIITTLFTPLASLGLPNAIFRDFIKESRSNEKSLFTGFVTIIISATVLLSLLYFFSEQLSFRIFGYEDTNYLYYIRVTLITSFFTCLLSIPKTLIRAQRKAKLSSILSLIHVLLSISLSVLFVVFMDMKVLGVIYSTCITTFISLVINYLIIMRKVKYHFSFLHLKKMLSYSLPFVPSRIQGVGIIYFGQYLINNNLGLIELGLYSIAIKFCMPFNLLIQAIQKAWVPLKFHIHNKSNLPSNDISEIVTINILIYSFIWLNISIWGNVLISFLTPAQYHTSSKLVPYIAFIYFSNSLYYSASSGFGITNNTKKLPLINFFGLISLIISSQFLIIYYGSIGVAISTSLSWLVMTIAIYNISQKEYKIDYNIKYLFLIIFSTFWLYMLYVALSIFFNSSEYLLSLFITSLSILGVLISYKLINNVKLA